MSFSITDFQTLKAFVTSFLPSQKRFLATRSFLTVLLVFSWVLGFAKMSPAQATDLPPQIRHKNWIHKSVHVRVTERGQTFFDQNFPRILFSLGFDISEGAFGNQSLDMEPLNIDQLAQSDPEKASILKQIRDVYTKYFVGPKWNDHRLRIQIGGILYRAEIKRMGIVADRQALEALGKRSGAVLRLELEIPRLNIALKDLIVSDSQNPWLGEVGLRNGVFRVGEAENPLRIVAPIYVNLNSRGQIEFQALRVQNNFADSPFDLQFQELVLPQIKIVFPNGEEAKMNIPEIEKLIREQLPRLQGEIRSSLGKWLDEGLPQQLNSMASHHLMNSIEQVSSIPPISFAETTDPRTLSWGLRLSHIQHPQDLEFWLGSYVEDPLRPERVPLREGLESTTGQVSLNHLSRKDYDVGFGVSSAVFNRLIHLSHLRGHFQRIPVGKDNFAAALEIPQLELVDDGSEGRVLVKVRSKIEVQVGPEQAGYFYNGKLRAQGSLVIEFRPSQDRKKFEMAFVEIPVDELILDESSIKPPLLFFGKSIVVKRIQELVRKQNGEWAANPSAAKVDFTLPLPTLMGINFKVKKIAVDPRQYIVVYTEYDKEAL